MGGPGWPVRVLGRSAPSLGARGKGAGRTATLGPEQSRLAAARGLGDIRGTSGATQGDPGRWGRNFTLTLLTRALCVCSPLSEERGRPGPREKIAQLEEVKQASIKQIQDAIDMEKAHQALVQKRHYLFDVQRNNIALALEVTYRDRLYRAYKEVKNRLDYHISVQNMLRRKEEEHMMDWVEKHVEKETINKCIADLKLLAKKAQAQSVM
ncbi:ATP synthase H+ transporting mitochondrial F0 complex subunit B1 [Cricetulus griseus]